MKTVGEKLKDIREKADLTLQNISDGAEVSVSFLSDIERGRSLPSLKTLQKLAIFYQREISSFLVDVYIGDVTDYYDNFDILEDTLVGQSEKFACFMSEILTERELRLVNNCHAYATANPGGLPGHNLMLIIYKLDQILNILCDDLDRKYLQSVLSIVASGDE